MFTGADRSSIRAGLLAQATRDRRVVSGAITGSAASGSEDDRSDIDLAFGTYPHTGRIDHQRHSRQRGAARDHKHAALARLDRQLNICESSNLAGLRTRGIDQRTAGDAIAIGKRHRSNPRARAFDAQHLAMNVVRPLLPCSVAQ